MNVKYTGAMTERTKVIDCPYITPILESRPKRGEKYRIMTLEDIMHIPGGAADCIWLIVAYVLKKEKTPWIIVFLNF